MCPTSSVVRFTTSVIPSLVKVSQDSMSAVSVQTIIRVCAPVSRTCWNIERAREGSGLDTTVRVGMSFCSSNESSEKSAKESTAADVHDLRKSVRKRRTDGTSSQTTIRSGLRYRSGMNSLPTDTTRIRCPDAILGWFGIQGHTTFAP